MRIYQIAPYPQTVTEEGPRIIYADYGMKGTSSRHPQRDVSHQEE
jgi:hypothetical protein